VECGGGYYGATGLKREVHHEFWHLMAFSAKKRDDPAWSALNDPSFTYGYAGYDQAGGVAPKSCDRRAVPGFVTCYATQSINEDQAEIYASMFVSEENKLLVAWMATDAILKGKVEYLKQFIITRDPAMSDYFG
jgi:hypothetical protein